MGPYLDETEINQGQEAFLALTQQLRHLLISIDFYLQRYENDHEIPSQKRTDLETALVTLASVPSELGEVIRRWKQGLPRVVSQHGVQDTMLNELWITMDVVSAMLLREGLDLDPYNSYKATQAYGELVRINALLS